MGLQETLTKIEKLLSEVETTPLSQCVPQMLSIALECTDYQGYCVLTLMSAPVSKVPQVNTIQARELGEIFSRCGLSPADIALIIKKGQEDYLGIKTVDKGRILTQSLKEMETWLTETKRALDSMIGSMVSSATRESYNDLSQSFSQTQQMYEVMRGYIINKLVKYQQFISMEERKVKRAMVCIDSICSASKNKVFIVHGHDGELKEAVARLLEKQGIQPIILHEQTNQGSTIIEKIERNSDVGCAICLFTADDMGSKKDADSQSFRARQNVVFETGYFIGRLGRTKVVLIADPAIEMPSDLQGAVYTNVTDWQVSVLNELQAIGFEIDYSKLGS